MTFNKNDIDKIKKAKEYPDYHGGELTQPEKDIFNDDRLITDKALLQNTAELLNNCKKAEANLVTERTSETGLSTNVNEEDENEERRVDKMVWEYQRVLFRKNNKTLDLKLKEALITFAKVSEEEEKVAKEITELEKKYNPQVLQEQTDLENVINIIVERLKDDLQTPNVGGHRILDELVKNGSNIADSCKTIIQTGYNVNGKSYTNCTFLLEDFPIQIITILKDLVKDKLFAYIDSSIKKFRDTKEVKKLRIYVSDIFRVMHTLFPKGSIYKDSPFLKVGNDASVIGKKYADVSANFFQAHKVLFPYEEKPLTWADVLSKDAVNNEKVCKEAIMLYEKKWHLYNPIQYFMRLNYKLYVEDFLKNAKDVSGNLLFQKNEVDALSKEWQIEEDEVTERMIDLIDHLQTQLKNLGDKLTNSSDTNIITYQETIAIRTLIYFLTDLEKEGKLETPLMATEKGYLTKLNNAQQTIGLSPEEETELLAINNYLTEPELRNELELKKIADILLNLEDITTFFNELKEYFKDKQGVPTFPVDTTDDYQKTDYFFTLSPHYVIGFSATYQIKHDSAKKKEMEDQMTLAKNEQKLGLDLTKYGNGTEFTEAGIIKYYAEELGGVNHCFAQQGKETSVPKPDF
nr:1636_t:CDS:2 [Entrophospora candida]